MRGQGFPTNPTQDAAESVLQHWIHLVGEMLGTELDPDGIGRLLARFVYPPDEGFFALSSRGETLDGAVNCSAPYGCPRIDSGNGAASIREILDMSVGAAGPLDGTSARRMLPECSWSGQDNCWRKVVTDRGVCFNNYWKCNA